MTSPAAGSTLARCSRPASRSAYPSGSTSAGTSTSAAATASAGTIYDLGGGSDIGPLKPPGGKDKIDVLFVMNRDLPLPENQKKILAALPTFIDTIQARFAGFDVHIMVTDADLSWDIPGGAYEATAQCDRALGVGTNFNAGPGAGHPPSVAPNSTPSRTRRSPGPRPGRRSGMDHPIGSDRDVLAVR